MPENSEISASLPSSKRGLRRLIQRAWVLTGRDRRLRDRLRQAEFTVLWVIEDWEVSWTLAVNRGSIAYERRSARKPNATLTWQTAAQFFKHADRDLPLIESCQYHEQGTWRDYVEPLYHCFARHLHELLLNPVDHDGTRLY